MSFRMEQVGKIKNKLCLLLIGLGIAGAATAQDENAAIAEKYKNEQAVITNYTEHLVIKYEDYKLVATTDVTKERMLISDLSPGLYNKLYIYHSAFNKLDDYDAYATVPSKNGNKIMRNYLSKTVPSEDDNIFYDDGKETEIAFTGLTRNSLVHTNYTISHTDLNMLPGYYFQENIPVVKSTFEVTAPKYVNLKFVLKGTHTEWIKQTKEESKNTITYIFTATDVPALKEYDDVPSVSYYAPHVITYVTSYKLPHQDKTTELLSDPDHLYTYYYNYIKNVNINDDENLDKTVLEITKDDKTQREKAEHIYQWVQKNMHYIAFEDSLEGFIPRQAADICKRKFGDCKDMASILTAMCRKAGIDAYFTWIGTRHKPYTYEETPLPLVANHMICTIRLDGQWIFLDGTDPLIPFGYNPDVIQGKEAMVAIDEKNYKILTVPETPAAVNMTTDSTRIKISGRNVTGSLKIDYKGYSAWNLETMLMYYKNDEREKYVHELASRGSNKYVQKGYTYHAVENKNKDAVVTSDFTIDDYVQNAQKEYYINMNLNRAFENNWVDTAERDVTLYYKFKEQLREVVVLDIPDGFHASYIPPDAFRSMNGTWDYKISYKSTPKTITLTKEYDLNTRSIDKQHFTENNKMIESLRKEYKESVVLTAN